jgi:hypothetical protein
MLNRSLTIVAPTRHVTERVTEHVHEHRAPTDASVKLLREMEAKAREQVVEAIHVGDTTFECVVHIMRHPMDDSTSYRAVYSLNGKKMTTDYRDQEWRTDKREALVKLRDEMAKDIATAILLPALARLR